MKRCTFLLYCAPVIFGIILAAAGCSSAPKNKEPKEVYDIKNQAAEYAKYGDSYFASAQYEQALKFFELALKDNISVNNEEGIIKTFNSIGRVYLALGSADYALSYFSQALDLAVSIDNGILISQSENNTGEIYLRLGKSEKALEYFESAINRLEGVEFDSKKKKKNTVEEKDHRPILFHNTGLAYKQQQEPEKALEYLNRALILNTEEKAYVDMADNYYAIASVYSKQQDYEKALSNALQALEYDKKSENSVGIAQDFYALAIISKKSEKSEDAYGYLKNSYLVYKTLNIKSEMKRVLELIVSAAESLDLSDDVKKYSTILINLGE